MREEVYICKQNFNGITFDTFSSDTEQDEYLVKLLVDYLDEQDIEIFERNGNVAATSDGWYGAFYKHRVDEYDKDTDIIGRVIDNLKQ